MFPELRLDADGLREPLVDYQISDRKEIAEEERADRFWGILEKDERTSQLAVLMKAFLCVSQISPQRKPFTIKIVFTENRMSIHNDTLDTVLSCEINYRNTGYQYVPTQRAANMNTYIHMPNSTP